MIQSSPFVPDDYICAAELASEMRTAVRTAQNYIKAVPDILKVRVGRTIYAPRAAITPPNPIGSPLLKDPVFQSYAARCRWDKVKTR